MMPRLLPLVLRRTVSGAALLAVIAVGLAVPARDVLRPAWPPRVEEVLVQAGPGRIERRLLPAGVNGTLDAVLIARSRPITLWRIELQSGEAVHAWLAGVRDAEGVLLPALPPWLEVVRLDGPLPEGLRLVIIPASREPEELDGARIARMFRPNRMILRDRLALWRDRLAQRWQWPFRPSADARMTPPDR
jgi:hypothetical protein